MNFRKKKYVTYTDQHVQLGNDTTLKEFRHRQCTYFHIFLSKKFIRIESDFFRILNRVGD